MTTVQVGKRGEITLPLDLLRSVSIDGQSFVVVEKVGGGILVRPAGGDAEDYSPERKAEFLLSNAVDDADYAAAATVVRSLGLDPASIPHRRPAGV